MKRKNFVDCICTDFFAAGGDIDVAGVNRAALKSLLPEILENELTAAQRRCLDMRFSDMMTQQEIARELKISQPAVSRHIKKAEATVANRLHYCMSALNRAGAGWLQRLE